MLIQIYGKTSNVWGIVWMEVCLKVAAEHKGMENGVPRDRHSVQACNFRYRASPVTRRIPRLILTPLRIRMKIQRFIIFPLTVCLTLTDLLFLFSCPPKVNELLIFFFYNLFPSLYSIIFVAEIYLWNVNSNFTHTPERWWFYLSQHPEKYAFYRDPRTRWIFIRDTFLPTVDRATGDIYLAGERRRAASAGGCLCKTFADERFSFFYYFTCNLWHF